MFLHVFLIQMYEYHYNWDPRCFIQNKYFSGCKNKWYHLISIHFKQFYSLKYIGFLVSFTVVNHLMLVSFSIAIYCFQMASSTAKILFKHHF